MKQIDIFLACQRTPCVSCAVLDSIVAPFAIDDVVPILCGGKCGIDTCAPAKEVNPAVIVTADGRIVALHTVFIHIADRGITHDVILVFGKSPCIRRSLILQIALSELHLQSFGIDREAAKQHTFLPYDRPGLWLVSRIVVVRRTRREHTCAADGKDGGYRPLHHLLLHNCYCFKYIMFLDVKLQLII